jgi:hypothetical protein
MLGEKFTEIKDRAEKMLIPYIDEPTLFTFDEEKKSITFTTEKLIPKSTKNRQRVMFLCSNPHPHSVQQGMFLSPNSKGQESLFWQVLRDSGWIFDFEENQDPSLLSEKFLNIEYESPFEYIFYCYYAFPTNLPEDIRKIFGRDFFTSVIETEATSELLRTINGMKIDAVVTLNKGIFNLVGKDPVDQYISFLFEGNIIQSHINGIDKEIPVFLTYPTGWRYHKNFKKLRSENLNLIKTAILSKTSD